VTKINKQIIFDISSEEHNLIKKQDVCQAINHISHEETIRILKNIEQDENFDEI
jgi:hypothetical protein